MRTKTPFTVKPPISAGLNLTQPLARSLAGGWLLNEGAGRIAHDVSGRHGNGTFSGEPVWSPGRFGGAVEFDGSDDWISMGDCLDLGTDDVTMLALVKYSASAQPDEWSGLHVGAIAGKGHLDAASRGYGLSVNNSNQIYWQVRNLSSNFSVVSNNALNDGQYHVAVGVCDRDSTTGLRLYIDGISQTATADPTPISGNDLSGSRAFAIGSRQENGGTWFWDFAGTVAAVYVWRRVLTEAEIRQLQCDPFALFAPGLSVALLAALTGTMVDCSGSLTAQVTTSADIRVTRDLSGSTQGSTSASAPAQVLRGISGTSAAVAAVAATLTRAGLVQVVGTASAVAALHGTLSRLTGPQASGAVPGITRPWLREALFNGMTSTACKLGTMLTHGWFWTRRNGCTALYSGAARGQVDLSRILQVVDTGSETFSLSGYLSPPAGSTRCYLVRRFNSCGAQEQTTAAAVLVRITPDGQLRLPSPNAVSGLKGEQIAGNRLRLSWLYCPLDQETPPQQFNLYWDGGTTQVDLENPVAVIPYRGRKFYHYDSGALEEGRYLFFVKAMSPGGVGDPPLTGVSCEIGNRPPEPVLILAAQSI